MGPTGGPRDQAPLAQRQLVPWLGIYIQGSSFTFSVLFIFTLHVSGETHFLPVCGAHQGVREHRY